MILNITYVIKHLSLSQALKGAFLVEKKTLSVVQEISLFVYNHSFS